MSRQFKLELQQVYLDIKGDSYFDYKRFRTFFLNALSKMVYLKDLGIVDDRLMTFFEWDFRLALSLHALESHRLGGRDISKDWGAFEWCKEKSLPQIPWEELPDELKSMVLRCEKESKQG